MTAIVGCGLILKGGDARVPRRVQDQPRLKFVGVVIRPLGIVRGCLVGEGMKFLVNHFRMSGEPLDRLPLSDIYSARRFPPLR